MSDVFGYFFSIGAGTAMGLSVGFIPALIVYRYVKKKGETKNGQTYQAGYRAKS